MKPAIGNLRDVPLLYPEYFTELLTSGGVPTTPINMARVIERTAFMIGTQGAAYFAHLHDRASFEVFVENFARGGIPARRPHLVDDMVDWLWAWNQGCHDDLRQRFAKWRIVLLGPGSFLERGREIPPFGDGQPDHEVTWRMVFDKNLRRPRP